MTKRRGFFLALGLTALIGLTAREGRAETITMTVSTNGFTIAITGTLINGVPTSTNFQVNTVNLNTALTSDGSAYQFSALGATSDFSGQPNPVGGYLNTAGGLFVPAGTTGHLGAITITTTEGGFMQPTGSNGELVSSSAVNYSANAVGTQTYTSMYNAMAGTPQSLNSPPTGSNSLNGMNPIPGMVAAPYMLTNTLALTLNSAAAQTSNGFSGQATVLASIVPEPASIVMMLTGLPLPLVVVGMLRRRRRAAA